MYKVIRNLLQIIALTFFSTMLLAIPEVKKEELLPKEVSKDWYTTAMKNLEKAEYNFSKVKNTPISGLSNTWQAPNRVQNLRAYVSSEAFYLTPRTYKDKIPWIWGMKLDGYGDTTHYHRVNYSKLNVEKNRVTYQREALSEWYTNSKKGIEQGFSIPRAISKDDTTVIKLELLGNLHAKYNNIKKRLQLFSDTGVNVLNFGELKSYDADSKLLKSTMSLEGEYLVLKIATKDVKYPIMIDPLATTPSTILEENQAGALFGASVSSAGDVNGDGYDDVIVGAEYYDNGQNNEGMAFVYLGSSSGLSSSVSTSLESNQADAYFGISVSSAGDVNWDGYDDVIVGANEYDNGESNEGVAFIYLGSSSGLSSSSSVMLEENHVGASFGYSVANAGDINGDGYSDVIVGALEYGNGQSNEGAAFIYLGSSSGLSSSSSITLEPNQVNAYFGISVSSAGDMNGDGYDDVIVGSYKYDNGETDEGLAFIYLGSSSGISSTASFTLEVNQENSKFGYSVASAGDVNGDGYDDVIVGAYWYDNGESNEGAAFIYLGSSSGISSGIASTVLEQNQASSNFGVSVASAGDVNGDGYSDVVVGANRYSNGEYDEGGVYIYLGSSSGLSNKVSTIFESNQASSYFGSHVASAGDVDGDGFSDIVVGAPNYEDGESNEGRVFFYKGSSSGLLSSLSVKLEENQATAYFGYSVSSAGDVNGDGYSDVVVGAVKYDKGQSDEGAAFIYLGSSSGLASSSFETLESNQANSYFGVSVASAGDINGDGYSDVVVGAKFYDNTLSNEGAAFVYLGSSSGLSNIVTTTLTSSQASAYFGTSVSSAGDVNGDGYSDIVVGAYKYDNGQNNEGAAFVYLGSSSGVSSSASLILEEDRVDANFGISVASAGDVNGDGYSDIIIGAYQYGNAQSNEGGAFIYLGSSSGLSSTPSRILEVNQADALFGLSVAGAGDVNGDGYSDVVVGAPYYDNGESNEGAVFVYLGSSSGVINSIWKMFESNQTNASFGGSVTGAGDVNSDGYSDIVVGAYKYDSSYSNDGAAFIYLGAPSSSLVKEYAQLKGKQDNARFGYAVAGAGDVNGDGYSDILVGAPYYDNGESDEGVVFIYNGSFLELSSSSSITLEENQVNARFGVSVSSAGDVNGDGYDDVIVGSYQYDNGQNNEGAAFIYLGSSSGLSSTADVILESNQGSSYFGLSVSTAGDINGDGYSDVIVGSYTYNSKGAVFLYLGSSSGLIDIADTILESDQVSSYFGYSIASAGDVNGDGYSDVIVGAEQYDNVQSNEGVAFIYLGSSSGLSSSASLMLEENQADANFGVSVSSAGDVNGDGYSDVIVGAPYYDNAQNNEGAAFVYLGSSSGVSSSASLVLEENQADANFGVSVSSAGDVNGDGYSDVIVGAPYYDNAQNNEGAAFVYLGSSSGVSSSSFVTLEVNQGDAEFGTSVSTAGDLNGDGYSDIVVGAYRYDNGEANEGTAFIYYGSSSGPEAIADITLEVNQVNGYFGYSVASAGDINGDGYSDLIVGAYLYDNSESDEGAAFVYYGNEEGKAHTFKQTNSGETQKLSYGLNICNDTLNVSLDVSSPYGRIPVKLEVELKEKTAPFDGTGLIRSASWLDSNDILSITLSGLQRDKEYHYRARVLYKNIAVANAHSSKWIYPVGNIGYSTYDVGRAHLPSLTFESDTYSTNEDNIVTLKVKEETNVCSGSSVVIVDTSDSSAKESKDYYPQHSALTWSHDKKELINIRIKSDDIDENDETFIVTISNPTNARLGDITSSTVTIIDNPTDIGLDSDGDGVEDSVDVWSNDFRFATDSDGDGLPDEWEKSQYGNLTTADGSSDYDGDGYSDLEEFNNFRAKVDPTGVESRRVEARRRLPPVLETLTMPEQMSAQTVYTISYTLIGYDSDYSTLVAYFDCTGKAAGTCGNSFGENFQYKVISQANSISNSSWTYSGEVAQQFDYSYDFTVPATREDGSAWASSGTDIVVRFYQKTTTDKDAGKGSLSLMLPGDISSRYYDSTGRRIIKTICPSGGCI